MISNGFLDEQKVLALLLMEKIGISQQQYMVNMSPLEMVMKPMKVGALPDGLLLLQFMIKKLIVSFIQA